MKKAEVDPLKLVVGAFIILATALVLWFIVRALLAQEATSTKDLITSAKDSDYDGVIDLHDACPCIDGTKENNGCPAGKSKDEKRPPC